MDLDCFFAAVEELDHPQWKGKPLAVARKSKRSIITTCNYEARKYGLYSSMPLFMAIKRCPKLHILPPRFPLYKKKSQEVFEILSSYTRKLEQTSIDEGYLDVTNRPEDALALAYLIQEEIQEKTGLSASLGVSFNKFLAKLASDWNKPHGIFQILPEDLPELLFPLSLSKIYGLGEVSTKKLQQFGLETIEDVYHLQKNQLIQLFGKQGSAIYNAIRGIDPREVTTNSKRKSLGIERTFQEDLSRKEDLKNLLESFAKQLEKDLQNKNLSCRTIQIKLKTYDFQSLTRSRSFDQPTNKAADLTYIGKSLLDEIVELGPFRLIGLSCFNLQSNHYQQLSLLD